MRFIFLVVLFYSAFTAAQPSDFAHINLKNADSVAALHEGENLKNLPVLTHKLTSNLLTNVEKFRAIYTWVSTNIENDYSAYLTTRKKRKKLADNREEFLEWNSNFTPKVFEKLLKDRKTACTGYAYLIREMAILAGFNCKIVNGYGRTPTLLLTTDSTPNHSWNKIHIDGKWYLCDATWSAGRVLLKDDGPQFERDYFDGYFLADPALFIKNHYPLEIGSALLPDPPSFEEFLEGPVVYKEAFDSSAIPLRPKKMHFEVPKNKNILFEIKALLNIEKDSIHLILNRGGSDKKIVPRITEKPDHYILEYTFKNTGLYDVHIQINGKLIATYVIKVRRK